MLNEVEPEKTSSISLKRWFFTLRHHGPAMLVNETKDLSLAPFVGPPAIVQCRIVICVSREWLQTTYKLSSIERW